MKRVGLRYLFAPGDTIHTAVLGAIAVRDGLVAPGYRLQCGAPPDKAKVDAAFDVIERRMKESGERIVRINFGGA